MSESEKIRDMVNRARGAVAAILGENICYWVPPHTTKSDFLPSGRLDYCDI